jgi:hypothetical protein
MKRVLLVAGVLFMAGSAHAQIGGSINSGGGFNGVNGIPSYRIASMRLAGGRDMSASDVRASEAD